MTIHPVILAGGGGTRLWPVSREKYPKQFQRLVGDLTLFQQTARRVEGLAAPIVVCNEEHRFIVAEQLRKIGVEAKAIIIEPVGRNTAPAAAIASMLLSEEPDARMLVMPSDHIIAQPERLGGAVGVAAPLASEGRLVTFGVLPTGPHTGYGYIQCGDLVTCGAHKVDRFVEKPDATTAAAYIASGNFFWNSGIFLFSAQQYLTELETAEPELVACCRRALAEGRTDLFFFRLGSEAFEAIRGISIDHAVMERTARAAVVPVDMGWSDVGSWAALWEQSAHDRNGNAVTGDVLAIDTKSCLLRSEDGRLVATIGVSDLVVVATSDAVLVSANGRDQEVRGIVELLKQQGRIEAHNHVQVYRPWGWFQTIDDGERYRVKQIQVNPGQQLSLQKHFHRSEHWVVVTGTALVSRGDQQLLLSENQSTFIPAGMVHRLENPGKVPLRIIEVQSGAYLGEDDIIRMDDAYGRTSCESFGTTAASFSMRNRRPLPTDHR